MTPAQGPSWERIEELFHAASELAVEDRSGFLDHICKDDPGLRHEIESLLEAADRTCAFLTEPIRETARQIAAAPLCLGRRIGSYQVLQLLGEGGMGEVYLAARADEQYQQLVAIKVLRPAFGISRAMLLRFRSERQILANLDHPCIARLLDGSVTEEGIPYLVMEYVDGVPIDVYCRQNGLSIEERLRLFRQVCAAVEYAHGALVVHRDIKPANILVTAPGVPKLLDFGIAKLLDAEGSEVASTRMTERLMTPEYASPEQVLGERITTATDVYALGVLLYELLSGQRPFSLDTSRPLETAQAICERMPAPPSAAALRDPAQSGRNAKRIDSDLDKIVLLAMRKEPARRYSSVARFSADITAYLEGYPLEARTGAWAYRANRFVRRHRGAMAAVAAAVLALVAFSIGMGLLARRANRQELVARRESRFLSSLFQAADPDVARGRILSARDLLDQGVQRIDRELAGQPEVEAAMLESMAASYRSLGAYDEGLRLARKAYALQAHSFGANDPRMADVLDLEASLLRFKADYAGAEPLFRQALALRQKTSHAEPEIADELSSLGECLYLEDKDAEAEPVLRRALAINKQLGADGGDDTRNYLALLVEHKGDYAEAVQLLRESLEIERRTKGANSPDYATTLHNLASAQMSLGDMSGAERGLREALSIRRAVLGNRHPTLAYSLNNLGYLLLEKGDGRAAEPYIREALAIRVQSLGAQHPSTAATRNNWARVLQEEGHQAEAEAQFRQALDDFQRAQGPASPAVAQVTANLGRLAFDQGQYATAERLARQALAIDDKLGSGDTPNAASVLGELGEDRMFQRDPAGAEPLLRKALAIRQRHDAPTHPDVIAAQVHLGEALLAEDEVAEATPVLHAARTSAQTAPFPLFGWQKAEAESAWAACLAKQGRTGEALALERRSHEGLRLDPRPAFRRDAGELLKAFRRKPA
ncbi:MAG TPA: serine/threonine-protein kinase [Rhizomicrobium sp.]|jgi:serine/threonine-protein kinase